MDKLLVVANVSAALTVIPLLACPPMSRVKVAGALMIVSGAVWPPANSISLTVLGNNAMLIVPPGPVSPKTSKFVGFVNATPDVSAALFRINVSVVPVPPSRVVIALIELDQIKGAEHGRMVMAPGAQQIEGGEAALVDHDGLAIDEAGAHGQALYRRDDAGKAPGEIGAVAGIEPHPIANAPRQDAEAVVLNLNGSSPGPWAAPWPVWADTVRLRNRGGRQGDAWFNCGTGDEQHGGKDDRYRASDDQKPERNRRMVWYASLGQKARLGLLPLADDVAGERIIRRFARLIRRTLWENP